MDHYPTPDGKPFTAQDPQVWQLVGTPEAPAWLPDENAMQPWLRTVGNGDDGDYREYYIAPQVCGRITDSRAARHQLGQALDLGCTAHLERARIGEFTRYDTTPLRPRPLDDEPPF
ncbi:hypothetical protein [Nocardia asiatica]|uniref:hypothetical protein n=1 Tax=Nocardia asiatica TaxID=209252 RepID=UPI0002EF74A1|nr:hypothetical protein [Nocardia asiatica]